MNLRHSIGVNVPKSRAIGVNRNDDAPTETVTAAPPRPTALLWNTGNASPVEVQNKVLSISPFGDHSERHPHALTRSVDELSITTGSCFHRALFSRSRRQNPHIERHPWP